jgi:diguanylate cyclase (GGDEF)-like protein
VTDVFWLVALVVGLSGMVSTFALTGNFRIAASLRKANDDLTRSDRELRSQNEFFNAALENMSHGLSMYDADGRLIVSNSRFSEIYRLPASLAVSYTRFADIFEHQIDSGVTIDGLKEVDTGAMQKQFLGGQLSTVLNTSDGRILEIASRPLSSRDGWISMHEDITERAKAEARISYMAHHDSLTDLPNRILFRERLEAILNGTSGDEKVFVLCLDLDHFKDVNDALGHPIGDQLLRAVAGRLKELLGPNDMVARLGGDEFALIQRDAHMKDNGELAESIIAAIDEPFEIEGHQVVVGTSVGIAIALEDGSDPDALLKAADMALYRAKTEGRGNFQYFEAEMDARMQERRALELDLRKALSNNELRVYYQPLVNLKTNRISGFEALLRWHHPERGTISPAIFIPLAEDTGLIGHIGAWVLKQACSDALAWPEGTRGAVNLSPVQFRGQSLVLDVMSALSATGLPARQLELEITESVMLQDTDAVLSTLHKLRELGSRISMDDFGTGYSSLSYLRKFPFDKIKIDQSFVRDLGDRQDSLAIVRAVSTMSASLGMDTTAEGVETVDTTQHAQA